MIHTSKLRRVPAAAALVAATFLAAGCASGPDIRADYDRAADFGKFRTFGFVAQAATDTCEFRSLATQTLQAGDGSPRLYPVRHT